MTDEKVEISGEMDAADLGQCQVIIRKKKGSPLFTRCTGRVTGPGWVRILTRIGWVNLRACALHQGLTAQVEGK